MINDNPITTLVLAERVRQTEKWGKQNVQLAIWLLILQEEMGEVAKALFEKAPLEECIAEAVQVTAVAVQMGEWLSERAGWPNSSEEVIQKALGSYKYGIGDPLKTYGHLVSEIGMIGAIVSAAVNGTDWSITNYTRRIIFYGFELIYRLQQKGGRRDDL